MLALIVVCVLGYRHRVARNRKRAAQWSTLVRAGSEIRGGRRVVLVECVLADSKGRIYDRFISAHIDGYNDNFEQALFDAKQDAITNCATLNS